MTRQRTWHQYASTKGAVALTVVSFGAAAVSHYVVPRRDVPDRDNDWPGFHLDGVTSQAGTAIATHVYVAAGGPPRPRPPSSETFTLIIDPASVVSK